MKAFELVAEVDERHCRQVTLPESAMPGPGRVIVLVPDVEEEGQTWMQSIAREWSAELSGEREDIYSLEDGEPVEAAR